jgi:hypothetical protein
MSGIDEMKAIYDDITIPEELDSVVKNAIRKAGITMRNKKRKTSYLKGLGSVAAALLIFAAALNASPTFANSVKQLPGGETVVRLLTFVEDTAAGGEITDGQDIKRVQAERRGSLEVLTVDLYGNMDEFRQGTEPADTAGYFTVTHKTHPYSIEVFVGGVRGFSAAQSFPDLSKMKLLGDIYKIVTFDDSAHRFVVTFRKPVTVEVTEQQRPARIILKILEDKEVEPLAPMYSLRTASFPFGADSGTAEEMLRGELGSENARQLRDKNGLYLAEEGLYPTRAEAEARMAEIALNDYFTYELHIEKREPGSVPEPIE